jgi:hypothetical protein
MAHYAYIKDGKVTQVIVGPEEDATENLPEGISSWEEYFEQKYPDLDAVKRTSYNTIANQHKEGGTPFRGNYACKGYIYDESNDVFYPSDPSCVIVEDGVEVTLSYTLNTTNWTWDINE